MSSISSPSVNIIEDSGILHFSFPLIISAIAIRNLFGSSLFLALREPVTMKLRASSNRYVVVYLFLNLCLMARMTNFISGAVLGAVISTLTFPFNTAKVHLQKVRSPLSLYPTRSSTPNTSLLSLPGSNYIGNCSFLIIL